MNPGTRDEVDLAVRNLRAKVGAGSHARIALVLGSGLNTIAEVVDRPVIVPYNEIPGFTPATAPGHQGRLIFGRWQDVPVVIMQGRFHMYEGLGPTSVLTPVRTMKELGCKAMILTNAAGCIQAHWRTPSLMLIADHINGLPGNPLVGANDDSFGPRFPDMSEAYDPEFRRLLSLAAGAQGIPVHEGVYFGTLGPSFETPAEIRAMRSMGADAVGMSTVHEVIAARHCGLRVAGLSVLTNPASGMSNRYLTGEEVLEQGATMAADIGSLLDMVLPKINGVLG